MEFKVLPSRLKSLLIVSFGWTIFLELTPSKVLPFLKQEMVQVKMSGVKKETFTPDYSVICLKIKE